jgi:hypothetical protein
MIMQLSTGNFTTGLGLTFMTYMVILARTKDRNNQSHSRYLEDEVVNQKSSIYIKILNNFHNPKSGVRSQLEDKK